VFGSVTRKHYFSALTDLADDVGSRLNGSTGGRTQMSSIITGILIVLSIFFLLPWLYFLPKVGDSPVPQADDQAVLAAIVVLVVYASKSPTSSQWAVLTPSPSRGSSRNAIPLAHESLDRFPPNDRYFHPHSTILD